MQNSGKDRVKVKKTIYKIVYNNPVYLESLETLPKNIRKEVQRVEEQELLVDPFPRPWPNNRLIVQLRGKYKNIYRIKVAEKYRYIYHVEGTVIYSRYVGRRGNKTYVDID